MRLFSMLVDLVLALNSIFKWSRRDRMKNKTSSSARRGDTDGRTVLSAMKADAAEAADADVGGDDDDDADNDDDDDDDKESLYWVTRNKIFVLAAQRPVCPPFFSSTPVSTQVNRLACWM
jgi:hypothetical protein